MTASACSKFFSSGDSRSMRAATIPSTVAGMEISACGRVTRTCSPLRTIVPFSNNARTISSMKSGLPSDFPMINSLNGPNSAASVSNTDNSSSALLAPSRSSRNCR
jgi:hypothetical protein